MSKFIFLVLFIFISVSSIGQEKDLPELNFDNYNFPKSIVINIDDKSQTQLKQDIQDWLQSYYSESSLIESRFSDHTFLITALENRLLKVKNLPSDLKYQFLISLRDNKYKFEISSISYKYYTEYRPIANINLIKDDIIKRDLLESRSILFSFFKDLNLSLFNSLRNNQDEW